MRIKCDHTIISHDELKDLVLSFALEDADRSTPPRVWFVYDTDGDGDVLPETVVPFHDYHAAHGEYERRLDEGDYRCKGFFAGPKFSSHVI